MGSGEVLMAARAVAFVAWLASEQSRARRAEQLLPGSQFAGEQRPDAGRANGADDRVHGVPHVVDVGHLVSNELDGVQHPGADQHVRAREHLGHLLPAEAAERPQHQRGGVERFTPEAQPDPAIVAPGCFHVTPPVPPQRPKVPHTRSCRPQKASSSPIDR